MDTKLLARIGAIIFITIAITMTAIEMSRAPEPAREAPVAVVDPSATTDPLLIELRRCQSLGQAGASDPDCLRAWAENQVDDPQLIDLGLDTFGGLAAALVDRLREASVTPVADPVLASTIFLATLERLVYFVTSRPLGLRADELLDELAGMLHRGLFGGFHGQS